MAEALAAEGAEVRVITSDKNCSAIHGVGIDSVLETNHVGFKALHALLKGNVPDVLMLQYNPFSWGHWGFNPLLPEVLQKIKRSYPTLCLAVMVHEPFVPASNWQFSIMTLWQRWQLWRLGHVADVVFFSIEAWAKRFSAWFEHTPVYHLPIGSNIPVEKESRGGARKRFGVEDRFVLGLFGSASTHDGLPYIRSAVQSVMEHKPVAELLYVGPDGQRVKEFLQDLPVRNMGKLAAVDVSRAFGVMDLSLAPIPDGVSTRRGTVMAALAHGVPVAGLSGPSTDSVFSAASGQSIWLSPTGDIEAFGQLAAALAVHPTRVHVGMAGRSLYEREFDWPVIVNRALRLLSQSNRSREPSSL